MSELPGDNPCTYEGHNYQCVRDNLIPYMNAEIAAGEAAARTMTNATLARIANAGHLPLIDQPVVFNQTLLDFLLA